MSISFLSPWFLAGALALAAPIWLHLRRRSESNVVHFSALRFLEDQPEPRRAPLRLTNLLLFALRALALLAFAAAFAWPYLRGVEALAVKESRVYILDNTLSHRANEGFFKDRARVIEELDKAGPGMQVGVIELGVTPRVVVSFSDARDQARQMLQKLQPSFQRGSYLAAFQQANSLLNNSLGEQKRIIFLGDNQENQWNEDLGAPPFLSHAQVELPHPSATSLPNLSLSSPRVQRIFLGEKSLVNFTVKLTHAGEAKEAGVTLRANGQVMLQRAVDLEQQPDTILLQAQWEAPSDSWLRGEASVEGSADALKEDNRVFFSLPPVVEGKVALLAQSRYLQLALSPEIMRGQWAARMVGPSKLAAELENREEADVLCLEANYLQSSDARKLLGRYLTKGKGVVLLLDRVTPTIVGYLRELGFEAEGEVDREQGMERFQYVAFSHSIFHPFHSSEYGNLMDIKVAKYVHLKGNHAQPLIFSDRGAPLFFQGPQSPGKLFVLAFGLDREHSSWPIHQSFIPFVDLCLQSARGEDSTPNEFEPGQATALHLPGDTVQKVVLRDAAGVEVERVAVSEGIAQIRLPDKPGLYDLAYNESSEVQRIFCINPSPKESQLTYVDSPEAMKLWQFNHPAAEKAATARSSAAAKASMGAILQQRWWWWMMVGGLFALLLEMTFSELKRQR